MRVRILFFQDSRTSSVISPAVFKTYWVYAWFHISSHNWTGFIQSFLVCCSLRPNSLRTPNSVLGGPQKKPGLAEEVRLHIFRFRPRRGTGDPKTVRFGWNFVPIPWDMDRWFMVNAGKYTSPMHNVSVILPTLLQNIITKKQSQSRHAVFVVWCCGS